MDYYLHNWSDRLQYMRQYAPLPMDYSNPNARNEAYHVLFEVTTPTNPNWSEEANLKSKYRIKNRLVSNYGEFEHTSAKSSDEKAMYGTEWACPAATAAKAKVFAPEYRATIESVLKRFRRLQIHS